MLFRKNTNHVKERIIRKDGFDERSKQIENPAPMSKATTRATISTKITPQYKISVPSLNSVVYMNPKRPSKASMQNSTLRILVGFFSKRSLMHDMIYG